MWSRTHLEQDERDGRRLHYVGWTVAPEGGPLAGGSFDVFPPQPCRVVQYRTGASPDVAAAFPDAPAAGRARFEALLELEREAPRDGWLVAIRPRFERGPGRPHVLGYDLPALPPQFLERVGGGAGEGLHFLGQFLSLRLEPSASVLDVGCGTGRMAIPLARFLGPSGRYVGLDVDPEMIRWCSEQIAARRAGFRFHCLDVGNGLYRAGGPSATTVEFPLERASVDFAYATSLFTHLQEPEARHYFDELARVTRPGATVLATFFVVDDFALAAVAGGRSACAFVPFGAAYVTDPQVPERVIGFRREAVLAWARASGFDLVEERAGHWCGRARPDGFQDAFVFRRRDTKGSSAGG
jgi:SAM-dependent methyltransferase